MRCCSRGPVGFLSLVSVAAVLIAGCSDSSDAVSVPASTTTVDLATTTTAGSTTTTTTTVAPPTATDIPDGRPYSVSFSTLTVVDPSRVTPAIGTSVELAERTIAVWLYLPDTDVPAPLIVFSHGLWGHPDKFGTLHRAWAEAGYAIAAPAFPMTNDEAPGALGNGGDGLNQPGDVSFVLDHLLTESADPTSDLADRFDPDRVGAAGLSLGGATTYEAALDDQARDDRFRAAIVMAGVGFTSPAEGTFVAASVPSFIMHGAADPVVPVATPQPFYDALAMVAPSYFATLIGGGHAGPFENENEFEPKIPGMDAVVHTSTIAFWDRYLLDIEAAAGELIAAADADGLSVLLHNQG